MARGLADRRRLARCRYIQARTRRGSRRHTSLDPKQIHARRFYLTAEVLSPSDRPHLVRAKLDFYCSHPENRTILLIRQDVMSADLHKRTEEGQ